MHPISLPLALLEQYFPLYVVIDDHCTILSFGTKLHKILPEMTIQRPFFHYFAIEKPHIEATFAAISQNSNALYVLPLKTKPDIRLKGGILFDAKRQIALFLLTPWISEFQQLRQMGLSTLDFAPYDPVVEYWFMLQTTKASLADARTLTAQLKMQKDQIAEANQSLQQSNQRLTQQIASNHQIKQALVQSEQRLQSIFMAARDIIALLDHNLQILFVNSALEATLGYAPAQVLGKALTSLFSAKSARQLTAQLLAQPGKPGCCFLLTAVKQDGHRLPVEAYLAHWQHDGETFYACTIQDISTLVDARQVLHRTNEELEALVRQRSRELIETNQKLSHLATHDDLTGLANRAFYSQQVQQKIAEAKRRHEQIAIVFIDLDRFKFINDSLGHQAGNQLLMEVSLRLQQALRPGDLACRLSGDEFALMLMHIQHEQDPLPIIRRLLASIQRPVLIAGRKISISCSCGISLYPQDGEDVEALLSAADIAMYRAKAQDGCSFQYYKAEMQLAIDQKLALEGELRAAITRDEFFLVYQAKVDAFSGALVGVEALVRWQHPERGVIPPGHFIEFAEQSGLIVTIGDLVLEKACQQLQQWLQQGLELFQVAINLSALQFLSAGIEDKIVQLLLRYQLPPSTIELEVTESMSMTEPEKTVEKMHKLSAIGLGIAIDDFGTGYSNLAFLQKFPLDTLKIDMAFIKDMATNARSFSIVKTIINIGHSMDLKIVAEGVETVEQLRLLQKLECDIVQGYLISRPLTAVAFEQFYRQFNGTALLQSSVATLSAILVLDDDCHVLHAISRCLQPLGRQVVTAKDSATAYQVLATEAIAVILCDQYLMQEKGVDFLASVTKMYPEISRILLTGATDFTTAIQAINCGQVQHFLSKPWNNNELIDQVKKAIQRHDAAIDRSTRP